MFASLCSLRSLPLRLSVRSLRLRDSLDSGRALRLAARVAIAAAVAGAALALPPAARGVTFEIERVDGDSTSISSQVALALDASGAPHIVYRGEVEKARYARKSGGAWAFDAIDFAFFGEGDYPSIEIDAAGAPRIIYQASNVQSPVYMRKSGGAWLGEVPQVAEQSGLFNSLELDSQGYPHFTDFVGGLTYMIRYHRRVAAGWITETVDFIAEIGVSGTALALDANDAAHVTYVGAGGALRYARRAGGAWTAETIDASGSVWAPIAIDASGNACVAYATASGVRYARRSGGAWTIETPFAEGPLGFGTVSLALDTQGEPHIGYSRGFEGDFYYARHTGGAWTQELVVDTPNYVGGVHALVLDAADAPHIAFLDGTEGDLFYARAATATGVGSGDDGGGRGGIGRSRATAHVRISPNPSRDGVVTIDFASGARGASAVSGRGGGRAANGADDGARLLDALIADAAGRIVRRLRAGGDGIAGGARDGAARLEWDGRDDEGRAVPSGVYFVRLGSGDAFGSSGARGATNDGADRFEVTRLTIVR